MTDSQGGESAIPAAGDARRYARLGVRVRAALYDWMILIAAMVTVLSLAISSNSGAVAKAIGVIGVVMALLYEPVMVWLWGGTLGHMATNLRVVDDRSLGNLSLGKATLRFLIKAVLSWYSFVTIMASRRLRAVHDVLTGSTVQIRTLNRAKAHDFAREWSAPQGSKPVSILRRVASILVYMFAFVFALGFAMSEMHLISSPCLDGNSCSAGERVILNVTGVGWLVGLFLIVGLGWRGRLWGFRAR